ncbi:MAG: protein-glutamate O-methyltransferase CheR [Myxococcales bacterium]|nr:protein-glutamate O-methyltransferase CheR [Myxococcales bacterium]
MPLTAPDYEYVRDLVRRSSAIVLGADKDYLVKARLTSLARLEGFGCLERFMYEVRNSTSSDLRFRVVEALTTNETSFFRDQTPFEMLRELVLPELIRARSADRTLRIWSAGCSSGQELYSVAMLLERHFPCLESWDVELLGTDLNKEMVRRARSGCYNALEVSRGLAEEYRGYVHASGRDFQVDERVRRRTRFTQLNLIDQWPDLGLFDVVLLRNVLIYFDMSSKAEVLTRVQDHLRLPGFLFLGGTETTLNVHCGFQRVQPERANCYRLQGTP